VIQTCPTYDGSRRRPERYDLILPAQAGRWPLAPSTGHAKPGIILARQAAQLPAVTNYTIVHEDPLEAREIGQTQHLLSRADQTKLTWMAAATTHKRTDARMIRIAAALGASLMLCLSLVI
jgi:hypothetical protein